MSQTTVAGRRRKSRPKTEENASEAEFQSLLSYESGNLAWPVPTRGQIDWLGAEESLNYLRQRKQEIEKATADPLRFGYRPRIWDVVEENIKDLRAKFPSGVIKLIVWGGNRCLRGDTKIYDPVSKILRRVDDIYAPFHVYSWDGNKVVIAEASRPFTKGRGKMLKVTMSNGATFVAAESHRVYTSQGWRDLSQLRAGTSLFRPHSTADIFQLVHVSSAQNYAETLSSSLADYHAEYHSHDERPQWAEADDRDYAPLQDDVPRRTLIFDNIRRWLWRISSRLPLDIQGGLDEILSRNPTSSRSDHRAILDVLRLILALCVDILYRAFCRPCKSVSALYVDQWCWQVDPKFADGFDHPESIAEYFPRGSRYGYDQTYVTKIVPEGIDIKWDFTVPAYENYILGGVIHHNSSKTRFASNFVNRDCHENAGHRWWCCDSTEAMSRTNQMRLIAEQFAPEWKNLERDEITDIRYSLSDGFSKNKYVCPNKSEVEFKFYSMDIANLPGPELDGIWCDELVPLVWVETLVYRLINRNGLLIITFTPELGWNETIGAFYEGAQVVEDAEAPLLPKFDENGRPAGFKRVPRVMQCADPMARIVYFHNTDNPFGNYPALVQQLKGKSEEEIGIRAYGVCTKSFAVAFPMFSRKAHVITEAQFAEIREEKGERYHLVDPCDGRMWFMIWVYCPHPEKWIIYREYPSYGNRQAYIQGIGMPGPWALSGAAADGVRGAGQQSRGFSLERYIEEIQEKEMGESVVARYIDSRYATSPKSERERMTTLIEQLGESGMDFMAMVAGKGRIIGTEANDGSVDMINSALYYDLNTPLGKWSTELGRLNEPQLQVLDTCPNVIYALEHWTGQDGQKGACKDPIDCIRGAFLTSVNYVGDKMYSWVGGGVPK